MSNNAFEKNIADCLEKKAKPAPRLTAKTLELALKELHKHRVEPIRFASTDVKVVKSGFMKGWKMIKKGAKPRKNGKEKFYVMITKNENIFFQDKTI